MTPRMRRIGLACACGLLWGAAATAMETLSEPTQLLPLGDLLALVRSIAWTWLVSGLWWALIALPLAHLPVRRLVLMIPPMALAIALVHRSMWSLGLIFSLEGGSSELMGRTPQPDALFYHLLWANLFYGGLYLLGFAGYQRAARSQQLLADLASSRAEVDATQQEERLRNLRGQLQPGILVQALSALHANYQSAPGHAAALFEELVRFLRSAMPAIRERRATLNSELMLVQNFADLRWQLGIGGGASAREAVGAGRDVPFPPLCLLPLVEELACDQPYSAPWSIWRQSGVDWAGALIELPSAEGSQTNGAEREAERKMRLELAALHGPEAELTLSRRAGSTRLQLRVPTIATETNQNLPFSEEYSR